MRLSSSKNNAGEWAAAAATLALFALQQSLSVVAASSKSINHLSSWISIADRSAQVPAVVKQHTSFRGRNNKNGIMTTNNHKRALLPHPHPPGHSSGYVGCFNYTQEELEEIWSFHDDMPECSYNHYEGNNNGNGGGGYDSEEVTDGNGADEYGMDNGDANGDESGEGYWDDFYKYYGDDHANGEDAEDRDGNGNGGNGNGNGGNGNGNGDGNGNGAGDGRNSGQTGNGGSNVDDFYAYPDDDGDSGNYVDVNAKYDNVDTQEDLLEVEVVDYESFSNGDYNPIEDFNITLCDTYENLWVWDLALTCSGDIEVDDCQCSFASTMFEEGTLTCTDMEKCPRGCRICETCFQLLGCTTNVFNGHVQNDAISNSAYFVIAGAIGLFLMGTCYYYATRNKDEEDKKSPKTETLMGNDPSNAHLLGGDDQTLEDERSYDAGIVEAGLKKYTGPTANNDSMSYASTDATSTIETMTDVGTIATGNFSTDDERTITTDVASTARATDDHTIGTAITSTSAGNTTQAEAASTEDDQTIITAITGIATAEVASTGDDQTIITAITGIATAEAASAEDDQTIVTAATGNAAAEVASSAAAPTGDDEQTVVSSATCITSDAGATRGDEDTITTIGTLTTSDAASNSTDNDTTKTTAGAVSTSTKNVATSNDDKPVALRTVAEIAAIASASAVLAVKASSQRDLQGPPDKTNTPFDKAGSSQEEKHEEDQFLTTAASVNQASDSDSGNSIAQTPTTEEVDTNQVDSVDETTVASSVISGDKYLIDQGSTEDGNSTVADQGTSENKAETNVEEATSKNEIVEDQVTKNEDKQDDSQGSNLNNQKRNDQDDTVPTNEKGTEEAVDQVVNEDAIAEQTTTSEDAVQADDGSSVWLTPDQLQSNSEAEPVVPESSDDSSIEGDNANASNSRPDTEDGPYLAPVSK